jgi:hypothetical protein
LFIVKIIAIAVLVLIALYLLGGIVFRKKLYLKKGIVFLFILSAGALIVSNQFSPEASMKVAIPEYQEKAPDISLAPKVVRTESRIYYVAALSDDGQVLTLHDYYTYDKKKWQYSDRDLPLDRKYYGRIVIYNR